MRWFWKMVSSKAFESKYSFVCLHWIPALFFCVTFFSLQAKAVVIGAIFIISPSTNPSVASLHPTLSFFLITFFRITKESFNEWIHFQTKYTVLVLGDDKLLVVLIFNTFWLDHIVCQISSILKTCRRSTDQFSQVVIVTFSISPRHFCFSSSLLQSNRPTTFPNPIFWGLHSK